MSARWFLVGIAAAAVACGGPNEPSPPDDPIVGPATPPVIQTITVPTSRVEAGQDIAITAVVTDAETPLGQLVYTWTANVGTITGFGPTVTWRHAAGLKAGADVVVTLTVVDTYDAVVNHVVVKHDFRVVSQSAPFRVHDSDAEIKELARRFLVDLFGDSSVPPEGCLVDFSDLGKCAQGKAEELDDIQKHRRDCVVSDRRIFSQHVDFMGPNDATVHNDAQFIDVCALAAQSAPDIALDIRTDFYLTTVYEGGRWWLCESGYVPPDSLPAAAAGTWWKKLR